jgi:hypothetical protein
LKVLISSELTMFEPRYGNLSEEAFALASLKEFVKLWGSGSRAFFQLECSNGQAHLQFSSLLGAPTDRHFVPPHVPGPGHPQHGFHAKQPLHHPRQKSQKQRERDKARAAAHRAAQELNIVNSADTAVEKDPSDLEPQHQVVKEPATLAGESASPASSGAPLTPPPPPPSKEAAVPAPVPSVLSKQAVPAAPIVTFNEVRDEFLFEDSEVKVYATGVLENCPDEELSEDYFVSLRKFICSEPHLENNVVCVRFSHLSSRQINLHFVHKVKVEISVKTARLWEPPIAYIKKHLAKNDWLKGNKTRITLEAFRDQ